MQPRPKMGSVLVEVRPRFWTIRKPRHKTASWFDQPLELAPTRRCAISCSANAIWCAGFVLVLSQKSYNSLLTILRNLEILLVAGCGRLVAVRSGFALR